MARDGIPLVDLRDHLTTGKRQHFVRTLGQGLEEFGFVAVRGHGISPNLLTVAYDTARKAFALPEAAKRAYETPENGRQRGYTSFGVEHAVDTELPDLKEFWHIGRSLPVSHPLHRSGDVPPNLFPAEVPGFSLVFEALFNDLELFANRLLEAVAEYLGQPTSYFADMVRDGNSVLRVIHYPQIEGSMQGMVRAAAHEDINLLTVLPASTRPGLEVMTRDGVYMPVNTPPDVMICDTGDMMELLTAGRLKATTHRVVNPEGQDGGRLSMPFFLHPHPDHVLTPLVEGYGEPRKTRDFLMERLAAIGVA